jgi:transcriptional regulator with AAA-type ATPase domain
MRLLRFAGRGRELVALASALAGLPAVVLIEGEAGVGKSRLRPQPAPAALGPPAAEGAA